MVTVLKPVWGFILAIFQCSTFFRCRSLLNIDDHLSLAHTDTVQTRMEHLSTKITHQYLDCTHQLHGTFVFQNDCPKNTFDHKKRENGYIAFDNTFAITITKFSECDCFFFLITWGWCCIHCNLLVLTCIALFPFFHSTEPKLDEVAKWRSLFTLHYCLSSFLFNMNLMNI